MKVKQISGMLNDVFGEILGEGLIAENLSNIVSAGTIITSSSTFGDNFENYAGKIVDKVGKTVFADRVYRAKDLGIWRDSWEYGSVLEKIRCDVGDYDDNCEWDLTKAGRSGLDYNENIANHIEEMFKFYPANTQAKYFNEKVTFKTVISITRKQLKSAFDSASAMARFIGMIENRIMSKMEIAKDQLQRRALVNLVAHNIKKGAGSAKVVDLKAAFEAAGGATIANFNAALQNPDFLRFTAKRMTMDRQFMTEPSKVYNNGVFYTHTPVEDSRLVVLSDLDTGLKFNLYGDTYNEEFVKLDNYKTLPFWQGTSGTMGVDVRSSINVVDTDADAVTQSGIIGVLFDKDAVAACNEDPEVRSQYNADGNFTNYFYTYDCSYYNDFDENSIVYVWGLVTE